MNVYTRMTKTDLVNVLKAIEANVSARASPDPLQRVVNDLQAHQIEIEIQNRELCEAMQHLEESRERYSDLYDFSPVGYVTLDDKGVIQEINLTATSMLGQHRAAHVGIPFSVYVDKSDTKRFLDYLQQCREAEATMSTELRLVRKTGVPLDVELHGLPVRGSLHRFGYRMAITDLTQRNKIREELHLMQAICEHCREAVVICDNRNYILSVNGAFSQITGRASHEVLGRHAELIGAPPADGKPSATWWAQVVETGRWQGEVQGRRKNGESFPQWLTVTVVRNGRGYVSHYIHMFSDLTKHTTAERTQELAYYDALTKLPNGTLLNDRLAMTLSTAQRNRKSVAVLFVDVDRLATFNDSLGQPMGDQLLQLVASRLVACVRADDTVSHRGSDEFIVVLDDIRGTRGLIRAAQNIFDTVGQPWDINGERHDVSVSIGVSLFPHDGRNANTLVRHANVAMRRAKEKGRHNIEFFTSSLGAHVSQ